MSLNYMLPNGVTMGFGNAAERDAYLASSAGAGAQTQQAAMDANPGQSIRDIAGNTASSYYAPGGAGFGQAPQGAERNWGANAEKNQFIAQQSGYGGDFGGGQYNQWKQQQGITGSPYEDQWNSQSQAQGAMGQQGGFSQPMGMISGTGRNSISQMGGFGQPQTMGFGQNSWANLPGMSGLLGGFGANATRDIASNLPGMSGGSYFSNLPGMSGGGYFGGGQNGWPAPAQSGGWNAGQANTGHNMMWSW